MPAKGARVEHQKPTNDEGEYHTGCHTQRVPGGVPGALNLNDVRA
jgi:hypothetical protein